MCKSSSTPVQSDILAFHALSRFSKCLDGQLYNCAVISGYYNIKHSKTLKIRKSIFRNIC